MTATGFTFNSPTPIKRLDISSLDSLNEFSNTPNVQYRPQVYDLRTLHEGNTTIYSLITPGKGSPGAAQPLAAQMDAMSAFSIPASALETAGKQDEVIRLKGALNEKDMELIELREQHMQLVARSQEARSNWETALSAKDRAIDQLEEALASRQRALDAANRNAAAGQEGVSQSLASAQARIQVLEANLAEAHATVMSQSQTIADQGRQLEAARAAAGQEVSASEARLRALQQEMASGQHQHEQLQRELKQLQALAAEKDGRLSDAVASEQRVKQQLEQVREQLQQQEALVRQQPQRLQQQLNELSQQLQVVQNRAAAKEASSRKYKEAVKAFKVKLQERDEALSQRQAQILELHTELSQLQRLLKMGPMGTAAAMVAARPCSLRGSLKGEIATSPCSCGSPGRCGMRPQYSRGSAEDAVAAATDELERLRNEVHGFHLELAALQAQLAEKDALLQTALSDASHLDAERSAAVARAEEATAAAFNLERQLREVQAALEAVQHAKAAASEQLAAADARLTGLQADQARHIRTEGELRVQLQQLQEQAEAKEQQQQELELRLREALQTQADAARRIQQLECRTEGLEAKLDASTAESGQALRHASRQESEAAALTAQVESIRQQAKAEAAALQAQLEQQQQRAQAEVAALQKQLEQQQHKAREEAAALQAQLEQQRQRALTEAADLQNQLDDAKQEVRGTEALAVDEQIRARELQLRCSRQMQELEARVEEAIRQAQAAEREKQQLEHAVTAAEAKVVAADRQAQDAQSEVMLLGRSLREAEAAVLDWQVRARQAEEARQDLSQMVAASETAVKQVQADLAQMQLTHSNERAQAAAQHQQLTAQQYQLERALSEAQAAKAEAERRLRDTERQLADMRAALDSQERLLILLREQVAEGGAAAARMQHLEHTVEALEASLSDARQTISQLRSAAASSEGHAQATVSSLLSELAEKSSQLVDAERRFSQLEALMQRIASRTGQGQMLAADGLASLGCGDVRCSWEQQPLRSSWAMQQQCHVGPGCDCDDGCIPSGSHCSGRCSPVRGHKPHY